MSMKGNILSMQRKDMQIKLPEDVKLIIDILEAAGYEAYAVGGCVRDSLLGREPNDWDITTNAKPTQTKELFYRTIDTGIQHGTVSVLIHGCTYEVTTYRIDGEYEDSRHPKQVEFTTNLLEDLKRRDFTVNAMAYNDKTGIVDAFGGIDDLNNGIIRCVGNPEERFDEDALRIMRAVRFAAQLGYSIEENTLKAISKFAPRLKNISAERINVELTKLIISDNPGFIRIAIDTGITDIILPEISSLMNMEQNNPHHCYNVGEHIIRSVENIRSDKVLRYAMLFHDIGKGSTKTTDEDGVDHFHGHSDVSAEMAGQICNRLRFDNDTKNKVLKLIKYHDIAIITDEKHVRRAINRIGKDLFPMLLEVKKADYMAQSLYKREEKEHEASRLHEIYRIITDRQDCISVSDLAINGRTLIEAGIESGPEIGRILEGLLDKVLDDPGLNTKEKLMELISCVK